MSLAPIPNVFTEKIAAREFHATLNGKSMVLVIEIGKPIQDVECVDSNDWRCPIRICSEGKVLSQKYVCGIDSFQVLDLAINQLAGIMLSLMVNDFDSFDFLGNNIDHDLLMKYVRRGNAAKALDGATDPD